VNDTNRQADLLGAIARRLRAHVNLIPLNPTPGGPPADPAPRIRRFADRLRLAGVTVTVRDTRGRRIEAACGQLRRSLDHPASAPVA
jgi:23S rRNA (adenine2503-C2)-methyltransferase